MPPIDRGPPPGRRAPERESEAASAARRIAGQLELEERLEPYGPWRYRSSPEERASLHIEDFSAIPFLDGVLGVEDYQHRGRLRSREGDLLVTATAAPDGYERYCRERLRMASPRWIEVAADPPLEIARAVVADGAAGAAVRRWCADRGSVVVEPYLGHEAVWRLAEWLAEESGARVEVLAPPPPVTWIANDKGAFDDLVTAVLGAEWLPPGARARTEGALAAELGRLARRHPRVALKRLRCASAMGNAVYDAAELPSAPADLESLVAAFLQRTRWDGEEEVQVTVWEDTPHSPSTQWWIPPTAAGAPRFDGVYDQILEGEEGVFVGSRPSLLPAAVVGRLEVAGAAVCAALQALGYVGRCSFDHLVLGDPEAAPTLRFTECNGRWGGTSTPMSFLDRILDAAPSGCGWKRLPLDRFGRPAYRAQDFVHEELVGVSFEEVLAALGEELYDQRTGEGRFLLYNVGPLRRHGKLDVVSVGATPEEADEGIEEVLPRRLGL